MFLKELYIRNENSIIREITFKKGVNFIVDETPEGSSIQATGNNVGKTTVLRLIDYCLGGKGKNIYQDPEFNRQSNTKIESFLKKNNIIIAIVLTDDIDDDNASEIVIERNFLSRKKKVQSINGSAIVNNKEFEKELKKVIYNSFIDKPTFRQIISKNIRDEESRMKNIVKVLNPYTKNEEYEALYLFWLGLEFDNLDRKYLLLEEKKAEERLQRRLLAESNSSLIEQRLNFVTKKIDELGKQKSEFNLNENYGQDLENLNEVKLTLSKFSTELSRLEVRKELIIESKEDLEKEYSEIDIKQIQALYTKAQSLIPNIQVTFEETVSFHNNLIQEKIDYITKELPQIEEKILSLKVNINSLLIEEKRLTEVLQKSGVQEDLEVIIIELNKQYEHKGKLEEKKRLWDISNAKLEQIEEDLVVINRGIEEKDKLIQERITKFNDFFSEMSFKLYGEYYLLSSQKNDKGYELLVTNTEGNPSTGKKKGQIAAFDFAYLEFADKLGIKHLNFIMHDQLESMHDNQINTLVDVANEINGQYIVPILRDKIPSNLSLGDMERLSLSQEEKLFKLA
ncbi:hypothetical protein SapgrDRAFT_1624 [Saprospira grandis DSM 2844]|uniref:DUF2326 domain-containing protein n=1 Tax=Saprospira grandis DSM 2844 TaxID=694433 RepID=J0XWC7_9BACT|nr:DUF2326 domain-containing protein [Saprospira grandis]EJF53331.1 hypothetical protein SapgrDRAFT_1624 [Saprospira grandis DSM 2844]